MGGEDTPRRRTAQTSATHCPPTHSAFSLTPTGQVGQLYRIDVQAIAKTDLHNILTTIAVSSLPRARARYLLRLNAGADSDSIFNLLMGLGGVCYWLPTCYAWPIWNRLRKITMGGGSMRRTTARVGVGSPLIHLPLGIILLPPIPSCYNPAHALILSVFWFPGLL